ncbi:MAG: hypothetical protein COU32_04345 [Candidatus Magasanikbacteria bacterium CG10_big_fil_rev_8_21_14_0_10_42_10]|uniref:Phospholipase C/D domain-containing protein n=2 Tax=Candidatus Magasanikiibacteriota TaxID=1752731 RepID=A0A2H0TV20_9BACT|nr:MAG: hypothetical protein COU32_04345 [Candidatus Magasanikbacteria bacterium CG10_big_fil_rev_8_21_14_0_10_42_10]PIZ92439.1 MAG: hypothetical protein COX82_04785 [Candidatus Magasanikbacteria bacterium CG_4_10_14_0_2_um_filter_41_10]
MSLSATHIRFALEFQELLSIQDRKKYLSGTVYPDSRYITDIHRSKTHYKELLDEFGSNDDFLKGMAVHHLNDRLSEDVRNELFDLPPIKMYGDPQWIISTGLKILQDISDFQKFKLSIYLQDLDYVETRNDEDISKVKQYNELIKSIYLDKLHITIEDGLEFWKGLGLSEPLAEKVKANAVEFQNDDRVKEIYTETVKRAKLFIQGHV